MIGSITVPGRGPIARANPVAKLGVSTAIAMALLLTVDVVTAGVAVLLELLVLPWCGLSVRQLIRHGWVIPVAAGPIVAATAAWGLDGGRLLVGVGPMTVTEGSLTAAAAIGLRILAIGLPGVVLLATTDPTDLADALAQILRLPSRFVLSGLAALRLVGVLGEQWTMLRLARRARGLGDEGPLGRLRTAAGQVFGLLVLAVRHAGVLATAMEARGFGLDLPRTWARGSRFGAVDTAVLLGGLGIAAAATAAGVWAGTWMFVLF